MFPRLRRLRRELAADMPAQYGVHDFAELSTVELGRLPTPCSVVRHDVVVGREELVTQLRRERCQRFVTGEGHLVGFGRSCSTRLMPDGVRLMASMSDVSSHPLRLAMTCRWFRKSAGSFHRSRGST